MVSLEQNNEKIPVGAETIEFVIRKIEEQINNLRAKFQLIAIYVEDQKKRQETSPDTLSENLWKIEALLEGIEKQTDTLLSERQNLVHELKVLRGEVNG